jgi:hypothetical protein
MANLQIFISLLSLFGLAHLLKITKVVGAELSLFHASVYASLILYCGALIGLLPETALSIRVTGLFGLLLFFRGARKIKFKLTPEIIFFTFSIGAFYLLCQTSNFRTFSQVDDFGYWGRASRALFENNALLTKKDPISHLDYPPIAALFQYSFTYFSGFEDRLALFAQGLLVISGSFLFIQPLTGLTGISRIATLGAASIGICSLYWIFSSWFLTVSLGTLSADVLLGLCFGLTLHVYFNQNTNDKSSAIFLVLPVCLFMTLLKPIGILFAFISIAVIFLDYLQKGSHTLWRRSTMALATLGMVFLFYASWKTRLYQNGIGETFSTKFTIGDIFHAFTPETATERQTLTIHNFIKQIFFSFDQSTYWFSVCVLTVFTIFFLSKTTRVKFSILPYLAILMGFFGYLLLLLTLYMFSFNEWEGTRLASIDRYTKTYLLGVLFFLWGRLIFLNRIKTYTRGGTLLFIGLSLLLILPNLVYIKRDLNRLIFKNDRSYVDNVVVIADQVLNSTSSTAKVYFIYSDGSDDESNVFNYLISPRKSNKDCSFIRPPEAADTSAQPWACKLSLEDFKIRLTAYDFVVFAKVSKEFIDYYLRPIKIDLDQTQTNIFSIVTENNTQLNRLAPVLTAAPKP